LLLTIALQEAAPAFIDVILGTKELH